MQVVHTVADLQTALKAHSSPAFVPTMGNLHAGHLALVRQAKPLGDVCVASIFVNRLQFAPHEDFDQYPRTLQADCVQLEQAGCDVVFAPTESELYPQPQTFKVVPDPALAGILEGHFRPGFFTGVCTVVMKLFQCVFAGKAQGHAVFGEKDFQQLMVLRHMTQQFALPIHIHGGPIVRSVEGLALSSRNGYLSADEKTEALWLSRTLQFLRDQWLSGQRDREALESMAMNMLAKRGWQPDYLTIRRVSDLQPPTANDSAWVALGAARLGNTRLIDNLTF